MIVPVMTSYDRIFEHTNLEIEMISGKQQDYTLFTSLYNIVNRKENQLGDVYVKYLEPIKLAKFTEESYPEGFGNADTLKKASLELTECLLKIQEENTPVNLNSLIASCILQQRGDSLPMS
jgi:glycerol-3-phosphate O-acyltransferase